MLWEIDQLGADEGADLLGSHLGVAGGRAVKQTYLHRSSLDRSRRMGVQPQGAPGEGVSLADCPARFIAWRAMDNGNLRPRWVGTLQWAMFSLERGVP